jgi:Fibronectin type III domain
MAEPAPGVPVAAPPVDLVGVGLAPPRLLRWRVSRRAKVASLAGLVVVALIAGLVVWSPWRPPAPSGVRATSPTATSAVVSWRTSSGSVIGPGSYLVLRDGRQVGSVPASATSWTDHGLVPGVTYHYTVVAAGLGHSAPSAAATVTALTPSPVGLTAHPTHTTVALRWSHSPLGPPPGQYVLSNGTAVIATLPGTTTSYTDTGRAPGASFSYTVVAEWGNAVSGPSAAATGTTIAAPLSASVPVHVNTVSSPGSSLGPVVAGYHWDDSWYATPSCTPSDCARIKVTVSIAPSSAYQYTPFPITLNRSGAGYSGSATAQVSGCEISSSDVVMETNSITLSLTPVNGKVVNGAWTAWTGTMVMSAPYIPEGSEYCPSGTWTFAVTSGLSGARPRCPPALTAPGPGPGRHLPAAW